MEKKTKQNEIIDAEKYASDHLKIVMKAETEIAEHFMEICDKNSFSLIESMSVLAMLVKEYFEVAEEVWEVEENVLIDSFTDLLKE